MPYDPNSRSVSSGKSSGGGGLFGSLFGGGSSKASTSKSSPGKSGGGGSVPTPTARPGGYGLDTAYGRGKAAELEGSSWGLGSGRDPAKSREAAQMMGRGTQAVAKAAATRNIQLSPEDLTMLANIAYAEAGIQAKKGVDPTQAYGSIVDTVLNRIASPAFPDTVSGVIGQKAQFEPVSRYGGVANLPDAPEEVDRIVQEYVAGRAAGKPGVVGKADHFLNPNVGYTAPARNSWASGYEDWDTVGQGSYAHAFGSLTNVPDYGISLAGMAPRGNPASTPGYGLADPAPKFNSTPGYGGAQPAFNRTPGYGGAQPARPEQMPAFSQPARTVGPAPGMGTPDRSAGTGPLPSSGATRALGGALDRASVPGYTSTSFYDPADRVWRDRRTNQVTSGRSGGGSDKAARTEQTKTSQPAVPTAPQAPADPGLSGMPPVMAYTPGPGAVPQYGMNYMGYQPQPFVWPGLLDQQQSFGLLG
jgi:hypothetical protein